MTAPLVVVVADANFRHVADRLTAGLPPGTEVRWAVGVPAEELAAAVADADVLVGPSFTAELAAAATRLRLVQVAGAGVDGVDRSVLPAGVALANTYHHQDAMAEYAVWAAVGLRRGLVAAAAALRDDVWRSPVYDSEAPMPSGLAGARVGLVGFGHVGERAWRAFAHFGCTGAAVTGSGRVDAAEHGLAWAGGVDRLLELCTESDVVLVSAPLTESTRGLLGAEELAAIGPAEILVNVARGPVVAEEALYVALRDRRLGAAALDVWYSYPSGGSDRAAPSAYDFAGLDNVVLTPHVSGVARGTFERRADDVAANVTALLTGEPLRNLIPAS